MSCPPKPPARTQRDRSFLQDHSEEMNNALLENPQAESSTPSRSETEIETALAKYDSEASSLHGDEHIIFIPENDGGLERTGDEMEVYKKLETRVRRCNSSFKDTLLRHRNLELKMERLEKKDEELEGYFLKCKELVTILIEEKKILDEEFESLQRQLFSNRR